MNKTVTAFAFTALLPTGAALAEGDDCAAPRNAWQPREAALEMAQENGWTVRDLEIDDGCYEIEGRDSSGRKIEVKLDPATLQVVEMEIDDDDHSRRGAGTPAPAGTAAPPQNGLFGTGAPPQARVN